MKKLIYLLAAFVLVFTTACDPMEDVYDEIGDTTQAITGEIEYELTDDDYDDLDLSFGNFGSIDDAKAMIPGLLEDKYPVWGEGSLALVTFKWYNPKPTPSENVYELSDEEHNAITGKSYGNFDRDYHIFDYLEATYPDAEEGDFYSLRYRFWAGSESTLTDGFWFDGSEWVQFKGFTEDEYKAMGESYPNFSSHDEAEVKIPLALPDIYKFNPQEAGTIVPVMYELYKGGGVTKSYVNNFIFDGTSWAKYNNVATETIQFGHDGSVWVPDNTINYTVTGGDISTIDAALSGKYPGPCANVLRFGSFDRRSGSSNYWSDDMLIEAWNVVLDDLHPGAEEGQKYVMSYVVYVGSLANESMKVIKSGGVWVSNE